MKSKITERLKHVGLGYNLDKLPSDLLQAVIESAIPVIEREVRKAEDRAIQKIINEKFVAKVIKVTLERKAPRRSRPAENLASKD